MRPVTERDAPPTELCLALPDRVAIHLDGGPFPTLEARMGLVLDLVRANVATGGGPFAAALFRVADGSLLSAGVNMVVASHMPVAHAEVLAIALAGARLGTFDLGARGPIELVASCAPCAMCLGALPWAGVQRLVSGARDVDARRAGFDEGDKPANWELTLRRRGIEVIGDIAREEAAGLLHAYADSGGLIYNGRPV